MSWTRMVADGTQVGRSATKIRGNRIYAWRHDLKKQRTFGA